MGHWGQHRRARGDLVRDPPCLSGCFYYKRHLSGVLTFTTSSLREEGRSLKMKMKMIVLDTRGRLKKRKDEEGAALPSLCHRLGWV